MDLSRTQKALSLVDDGVGVRKAADAVGISRAAVYAALKRREGKDICACCKQVIRPGFTAKRRLS
jgi:predicted transcriptional regulator